MVNTGLGLGGGSQTLVRAANTLKEFGHDVSIVSTCKNYFTWEPLAVEHIIVNASRIDSWPKSDIIISTGAYSIFPTIKYSEKFKIKHWSWIRGFELWNLSEDKLIKLYSCPSINLMANSKWLVDYISKKTNKKVKLQYSGILIKEFYNLNLSKDKSKIRIGGLFNPSKITKNWNLFTETAKIIKSDFKNFEFCAFGTKELKNIDLISEYYYQPTIKEKRNFYNSLDVWVSLSSLEGCHIPPMEASCCGCALIVNGALMAGVSDYAVDNISALTYNNINELKKHILSLAFNEELRGVLNRKANSIIKNSIGDVETNMKKLIRILEE